MSRSRLAALILALLTAGSIWLSAGTVAVPGGDTTRVAALPAFSILAILAVTTVAAAWLVKLELQSAWPLFVSLVLWLPFAPFQVPVSWLLWEGPIEGVVWLVVLAGLLAARPPTVPPLFLKPTIAPWIAAAAVAVSSMVVFSQVRNVVPGGDEPHYLAATQSLIHDADLKVANNYAQGDYLDYFPGRLEPHFLKRSTSGEIYSIHAPGVSVIVLPAFAIAGYLGAVLTMIAIAAAAAWFTWLLAFRVSKSVAGAWTGTAAVFATAPYFFHSFTIYPEILGSLCVILGAWLLVELNEGRDVAARELMAIGLALAVLPWLHSRFAVLAGVIGLCVVVRLYERTSAARNIAAFLAVPAMFGAAWFAFFYLIWGSPSPTAAYGPDTSTSVSYIARGLIGLVFDQQFGVLTTAPIYVMAAIGGVALFRARPRLAIELALIVIPYAMAVASYAMWWGGVAAPGRFVVAALPLAAVPIAIGYSGSRTFRAVALVLLVVSAALVVPRALEDNGRFIYNTRSGVDATLQWLSANVDMPSGMPSVHRGGGYEALRFGAAWLTAFAIASGLAAVLVRRRVVAVRMATAGLLMAAVVMIADGAGFALRGDRQLANFDRFRPSWQTTIVRLPTRERNTAEGYLRELSSRVYGPATSLNRVPAGDYILSAAPGRTSIGTISVSMGRGDAPPIAKPSLAELQNQQTGFRLHLPVMARTLNFRIDPKSNDDAEFRLRPIGVTRARSRRPATRAARYGPSRAFFFDDWAYPERDGFWTRADGSATVVIDTDDHTRLSGLQVSVTAGAVPTTIALAVGSWKQTLNLAAGQKQDVTLPAASDGAWVVSIRSGQGFRPSEREPGNSDVRSLAAWIAIR